MGEYEGYVKYADSSVQSLQCSENRHSECPQAPDNEETGMPPGGPVFGGYYCECDCDHDGTEPVRGLTREQLTGLPLYARAPEVTRLLAQIREQEAGNSGGWPGADTIDILCEWFKAHGYDIDTPLPEDTECDECGAEIPDSEPSMVSASHYPECSLYPGDGTTGA